MDAVTEGGVVLADYDWDTLSRRDLVKLNANAFNMDLAYEADDDLATLAHTGPAPLTFTFGRNNSGQITSLTASDGAFLSRPVSTVGTVYVPNRLNQYASVGGTGFGHDANGNLTSDGVYTFEYDEENRLRSAVGGGFTTSYEYDPLGRRRAKVVNGITTKYVSDNAEEVEERDGSNVILRRYVYGSGIDERIAMLDSSACTGGRCFYLTNWQGSTTTLVNQTGSTLNATYHYGPYGEGTNWSPADALTGNAFRYTGRRVDPETGLYYYRARYYSPKLGRFLQTDPIGIQDDLNLYSYTYNEAVNRTDPSGECLFICSGIVGAVVGGVYEFGKQQARNFGSRPDWGKVATSALKGAVVGIAIFTGGAGAPLVGATEAAGVAFGGGTGTAAITALEGGTPSDVTTSFLAGATGASVGQVLAQGSFSSAAAREIASLERAGTITEAEAVFARGATVAGQKVVSELGSMVPDEIADAASAPDNPSNNCKENPEKC